MDIVRCSIFFFVSILGFYIFIEKVSCIYVVCQDKVVCNNLLGLKTKMFFCILIVL